MLDADTGAVLTSLPTVRSVVGDVTLVRDNTGKAIYAYAADLGGYGASMLWSGVITAFAAPFVLLSRRQHAPADTAREVTPDAASGDEPTADDATPPAA